MERSAGIKLFQVNAFADEPFTGNPAAVCLLDEVKPKAWMQNVAREMNLPETAFLVKVPDGYDLRWFTPQVEVDLCGHATLASAHVLWEAGLLSPQSGVDFFTPSGKLSALKTGDLITLDFPTEPAATIDAPSVLSDALGIDPKYIGKNRMDYLVEIDSEAALRALNPDMDLLKTLGARGVIVTSKADSSEFDFVSRFFAPSWGIDEDPVTGSAHCCLGPYWMERTGKSEFRAFQASERGGVVIVSVMGERVRLGGHAVTIWEGDLHV